MAADTVTELNTDTFDAQINNGVTLVDFWAPWCGPCKALGPTIDELSADYQGKATVAKVNVDDSPEVAAKFGIQSIPTVIVFKDGQAVQQIVGMRQKADYAQIIDEAIAG